MMRHAKGVDCKHPHHIEVTKRALVTCPACKTKLNDPEISAKFDELETLSKLDDRRFAKNSMNILAKRAEEKGGKICPRCGANMKVRKNKNNGSSFWGCSNYPDCKTTRQFEE